ncbi:MAG: HD domain-containing protein [Vampirovibrio sp.]|nr:HD domain-containing protein [Vampirovibrio sp.]
MKTVDIFSLIQEHPAVQAVHRLASAAELQVLIVGGAVRDVYRTGTLPQDLDFVVLHPEGELQHPAEGLSRQVADALKGHYVLLDAEYGIHRIVIRYDDEPELVLDISDALNNSLVDDLNRRDLTVNSVAMDLATGQLHDPHGGLKDAEAGLIQMVSMENLLEDPLRLLRVFRIAATIGANKIDLDTLAVVQEHGAKLLEAAPERIHYEFFRLLNAEPCFEWLLAMADSGLLEVILPEFIPMRDVQPNRYHHLGLFEHTLELVKQSERLIEAFPAEVQGWIRQPFNGMVSRFGLIKLACLLHDIGKPATMEEKEDGKVTFYGHDQLSEEMTEEVAKRWKLSRDVKEFVQKLVRWHLYPCQFGPDSSRKSVMRFFRRMGETTPDVLLLALADRYSAQGPMIKPEDLETTRQDHLWLAEEYLAAQEVLNRPRLLDGREVMELLGLAPGPEIGKIMSALQEAQQLDEVTTPEEARGWVKREYG